MESKPEMNPNQELITKKSSNNNNNNAKCNLI